MNRLKQEKIIVRKINFGDIYKLQKFYYTAYGFQARYRFPERWEWLYKNNPWIQEEQVNIYIAESLDKSILGHTGALNVPCKVLDNKIIISWSIDTIVLPEWRGKGIGKKLQITNQNNNELFASLSMSEANKKIKLQINGSLGPECILFIHFASFNHKNQYFSIYTKIKKVIPSFLAHLSTALLYPLVIVAFYWLRQKQKKASSENYNHVYNLKEKNAHFGREADIFWSEVRKRYNFAVERNSKYLNWRYASIPWCTFYSLEVRDKWNCILGQAIYRMTDEPEHEVGIITELMDKEADVEMLKVLVLEARDRLIKRGAKQVFIASSDTTHHKAIKKAGFLEISKNNLVYHYRKNLALFNSETSVLLTKGDQDWDQYPLARELSTLKTILILLRTEKKRIKKFITNWHQIVVLAINKNQRQ